MYIYIAFAKHEETMTNPNLNDDKTEVILTGTRKKISSIEPSSIKIGDAVVPFASSVRNLGVMVDSDLQMETQVSRICKICYYHLRNISYIRHMLSKDTANILVRSLVISRLDYCNSLYFGISEKLINKLQKVQNAGARIISRSKKSSHITPILKSLHWLPMRARVDFKVLCLTYQCYHQNAPKYLNDIISKHVPPRALRSSDQELLTVPNRHLKSYGLRSFSHAGPSLSHNMPLEIILCSTFRVI